jgi:hypothetical protein
MIRSIGSYAQKELRKPALTYNLLFITFKHESLP